MKQILLDFWHFIKKPKDEQYSGNAKAYKWKVFFTLFGFNVFFSIVFLVMLYVIEHFFPLKRKIYDLDLPAIVMFVFAVIVQPFLEEVVFRLGLRRKGFLTKVFTQEKWNRYFSVFVYTSVIVFALAHGTNYIFDNYWLILLVPFLTISQFVTGFINTYLRVRFNFGMGYLFHTCWNLPSFIIAGFLFLTSLPKETIVNRNDYQLEIKEKNLFSNLYSRMFTMVRIDNDTVYQLESKGMKFRTTLKLIDNADKDFEPISDYVDINLTTETGIHKDSLLFILEKEGYIEKKTQTN